MKANNAIKISGRVVTHMAGEFDCRKGTVGSEDKIEVKVGSGSVIVEQSELHNLIEALSELKSLVARDRALMDVAST